MRESKLAPETDSEEVDQQNVLPDVSECMRPMDEVRLNPLDIEGHQTLQVMNGPSATRFSNRIS